MIQPSPAALSFKQLEAHCLNERSQYKKNRNILHHRSSYCFELFRRAFDQKDDQALAFLYNLYLPQVAAWAKRVISQTQLDYPLGFYIADCMSHFVIKMRGMQFENFKRLDQIMAYWKKCVFSLITDALRKKRLDLVSFENLAVHAKLTNFTAQLVQQWILSRVQAICSNDRELLLADLNIYQGLKPRKISKLHADVWPSAGAVSTALSRLKKQLQQDEELKSLMK